MKQSKNVISKKINNETILLDMRDGTHFSLNETAAQIWSAVKTQTPIEQMVATLADNHANLHNNDQSMLAHSLGFA